MEPVAVWKRAPIAFAIVLLLVGGAAGFGVGYSVGDSGGKSTAKVAKGPSTSARGNRTPAQQRLGKFLICMRDKGVKWPKGPASRISKPPAGVSQAKYNTALSACYGVALKRPSTNTTVRSAGP